jgi:hypothetical protein
LGCRAPDPQQVVYEIDLAPVDDEDLSPITGWTREHHEAVFGRMLLGYVDNLSDGRARTTFSGGTGYPASMEGAVRMLPAIGAWLSDPENPAAVRVDGVEIDLEALGRDVVVHGTDPGHPDYWGEIEDAWHQSQVEAGPVAEFLVESRLRVWDALDESEQKRVMQWLAAEDGYLPGNWSAFQAARNVGRAALGYDHSEQGLLHQLDLLEADYIGDGWYEDAEPGRFDYYNAYVYHPGLLFWAKHLGDEDPERRDRVIERTRAFLFHFPAFFSDDGAPIAFGRSLSYRSAVTAPVVEALAMDLSPLSPGQSRRLVSGSLAFHLGGDVNSTDRMLDDDDVLRLGFVDEDPRVLEGYIRPGSQYFAANGLRSLALARDHAFWRDVEEPTLGDEDVVMHEVGAAGFSISRPQTGTLTLLPAGLEWGKDSQFNRYAKLAYTSDFFFNAPQAEEQQSYDSLLMYSAASLFNTRRWSAEAGQSAVGFAYNRYRMSDEEYPLGEHRLDVASFALGEGIVRFTCATPGPGLPRLLEGGFVVDAAGATMESGDDPPWQMINSPGGGVILAGLLGYDSAAVQEGLADVRDQNVVHDIAVYPSLSTADTLATNRCFASFQLASAEGVRAPETWPAASEEVAGESVRVEQGPDEAWATLVEDPPQTQVEAGGVRFVGPLRFVRVDGETFTAAGVEQVEDLDENPVVEMTDGPSKLHCRRIPGRLECTVTGPATLHLEGASGLEVLTLERDWEDATDDVPVDDQSASLSAQFIDANRHERSAVSVAIVD